MSVADAIADAYGGATPKEGSGNGVSDAIADAYTPVQESHGATGSFAEAPSAGSRFTTGLTDLFHGMGQVTEHVAEPVANAGRAVIRAGLNAVGADEAAGLFHNVSTDDFDKIVRAREQDYEQARQDAGQTGIDWWRLAGNALNPLNFMTAGGPAATAGGRIAQAGLQGGAVALGQPEANAPGSFWWDKAKGTALGAVTGAGTAGVIEAVLPAVKAGINGIRNGVAGAAGLSGDASAEASQAVNNAIKASNVDPASLDLNVLQGLKKEAQSSLEAGHDPSPIAILNRAKAESLPVPVTLTRGQATGDAMQFAKEQNLRGITGVGEPITQRLTEQNGQFIANLDALGAKDAPDTASTGTYLHGKISDAWNALQENKDALYAKVRNSKGQSAMMDQFTAVDNIKAALDNPQASYAYQALPANIQRTLGDLADGKLPLNVAQMQRFDQDWGQMAAGADGNIRHSINQVRQLLREAPLSDDIGGEATQAWAAAKQAHAQQMSLVEPKLLNGQPNPRYSPLMDTVVYKGTAPEKLFNDHFGNAVGSVAAKNLNFVKSLDPNAHEIIGRTLMGEIKRQALNSTDETRGAVSAAVLKNWANEPIKSGRLDALLTPEQSATFRNLSSVVQAAKIAPVASAVNTSNTGSAVVNAAVSALKDSGITQVTKRLPIIKQIVDPIQQGMAAASQKTAVQDALNPGVSLRSLLSATPSQAARRSLSRKLLTPGAVAGATAVSQAAGSADEQ